jgi:site-specific recombinase XerD
MASLRRTRSGKFIACFRFAGQQHQRALKTEAADAAQAALGAIVNRIYKLTTGDLVAPDDVDIIDFIVWGEAAKRIKPQPEEEQDQTKSTLEELIPAYLEDQKGLKADSTLGTEQTHLNNLKRYLGPRHKLPVDQITEDDLNAFLKHREEEAEGVTVQKERQTLLAFFKWVARKVHLRSSPAGDLRMVQAGKDRSPFRTLEEVEAILKRGGLSDEETAALWESLYLTGEEIGEILTIVKEEAEHDFIYPMFALAAYTGMRRGEIVRRLRWSDINFSAKTITARSQKQSRQQKETARGITMHPKLEAILRKYQEKRPRGQYVICHAKTLLPLSVHEAHGHFQRTLRGTTWERKLPSGKKKIILGFHTFRHSFASNLAIKGIDQRIIDQWMGHQTAEMTKRYQHLHPRDLHEGICKLSFVPADPRKVPDVRMEQ